MTDSEATSFALQHRGRLQLTVFQMFPQSNEHSTKERVNNDMNNENKIEQSSTTRRKLPPGRRRRRVSAPRWRPTSAAPASSARRRSRPAGDAANPFGIAEDSTVDAVIFDGGYGVDYVEFAADIFDQVHEGSTVEVSPSTQIATELQPRFVGGNPPDLIDNSGAQAIGFNTILDQLEDLTDVIDAPNLEGTSRSATRCTAACSRPARSAASSPRSTTPSRCTGCGTRAACSRRTAGRRRRTGPRRSSSGPRPRRQDKYLFCWGKEAATYYRTMCHRVGDQGGRRRGAPGVGEPRRRAAGRTRPCRRRSRRSRRSSTPATCSRAAAVRSSPRRRRSGASTRTR